MSKHPGRPGLYQVGKTGKRITRTKASLADLAEAASKAKAHSGRRSADHLPCGDPAHLWGRPIPKTRRCQHRHKGGGQCKRWAMLGASRCWHHGGLLDNPNHPSARRWIAEIEAAAAKQAINQEIRTHDPQTVATVRQAALTHTGTPPSGGDILQGIKALDQDDNGKAWRRWLSQLTAPATEKRARKCTKQPHDAG